MRLDSVGERLTGRQFGAKFCTPQGLQSLRSAKGMSLRVRHLKVCKRGRETYTWQVDGTIDGKRIRRRFGDDRNSEAAARAFADAIDLDRESARP